MSAATWTRDYANNAHYSAEPHLVTDANNLTWVWPYLP
jgi:hypothetical protein